MVHLLSSSHIQKLPRVARLYFLTGCFTTTNPEMKFHFISPAMTNNVNRIFYMAEQNFILSLM